MPVEIFKFQALTTQCPPTPGSDLMDSIYPHKHTQHAILCTIQESKSPGLHVACLRNNACNDIHKHLYSICMCRKDENQLRFPVLVAPPQEVSSWPRGWSELICPDDAFFKGTVAHVWGRLKSVRLNRPWRGTVSSFIFIIVFISDPLLIFHENINYRSGDAKN
jgi:hypothetical protein